MLTSRTISKWFWSGGKGSWKKTRQCEKSKGIINMLNQRQCCQNLLFSSSTPHSQEDITTFSVHSTVCHSWVAITNSPQSRTTPKPAFDTAALISSAQGCQHALPCGVCQPCPRGTQGRAESRTQPQVYTGSTPSRGNPQDYLFFPVIPTLSTARYFCLPQPQLLHHKVEMCKLCTLGMQTEINGSKQHCSV